MVIGHTGTLTKWKLSAGDGINGGIKGIFHSFPYAVDYFSPLPLVLVFIPVPLGAVCCVVFGGGARE